MMRLKQTIWIFLIGGLLGLKAQERLKVDGVAAVIGEYVVLESDVKKFKKEITIKSEGKVQPKDCEVLEDIMLQKLLAHHAVVDSILVLDAEVEAGVERNIAYFKQQLGSMDKVVDLYGFDDEADLKEELKKIERENLLTSKERQSITEKVTVTPEEIRQYYKNLEASDNLPTFGTEIKLAQITVYAKPSVEAEEKIIKDLNKIRKDIQDGANMKIKALIYSEDPGVAQNGGLYSITRESQFVKEFKEAAFSLELNEVSEPFKSDFGYHILKVEKIKGQQRDVRHILMQPAVSDEKLKETEELVKGLRDSIIKGDISFDLAVKKYSQDKATNKNKGILINPYTNDSWFELTRMDPSIYARVDGLNEGELSEVFFDETREGEKMYKVIMLTEKIDSHQADLVFDYVKIQQLTLQKKQQDVIKKWNVKHIKDTYVKLSPQLKDCDLEYNWLKDYE